MKKILTYFLLAAFALTSCVDNDLPYPIAIPNITSVIVDEADKIDIDYENQVVTIHLPETADIRNVMIRSVFIFINCPMRNWKNGLHLLRMTYLCTKRRNN